MATSTDPVAHKRLDDAGKRLDAFHAELHGAPGTGGGIKQTLARIETNLQNIKDDIRSMEAIDAGPPSWVWPMLGATMITLMVMVGYFFHIQAR